MATPSDPPSSKPSSADALRPLIGAEVEDLTLYRRALTHRSRVGDSHVDAEVSNVRCSHDAAVQSARRYLLDPVNIYEFIDRSRNYKNLSQERLQAAGCSLLTYTVITRGLTTT